MDGPVNGPIEVVFCFDTTGSMAGVIAKVKNRVTELTERLLADIPDIRIGILGHGDYGDEPHLLQRLDLTNDGDQLRQFILNVRGTFGGDAPECYELALQEVRTNFSWTPDARKRLVIIGDDEPHDIKSPRNLRKIDWRQEAALLKDELRLVIYSVQACGNEEKRWFWKGLADMTGGKYLELSEFTSIFDFLMAICYLEHGAEFFEAFQHEVQSRDGGATSGDVSRMLRHLDPSSSPPAPAAATPRSSETRPRTVGSARPRTTGSARPRTTGRARPMKAKRTTHSDKRKRLRRAVALSSRPKRENEPFCEAEIAKQGRWSPWHVLASPSEPKDAHNWRRFGHGFLRHRIVVPASAAPRSADKTRVLVELAVERDDATTTPGMDATPLYSRILCDSATNAVASLLHGNAVLKWRLHRAVTRYHRVLLRFARIDSDGRSLCQQRRQLRKTNSYAWNSGRVVTGDTRRHLLSVPAPRARQLANFLRTLADEKRSAA